MAINAACHECDHKAAMTRDAGQGPGIGGGPRKSYEPEHAGHSSVAEEDSFFGEFFDGVPFDAPCNVDTKVARVKKARMSCANRLELQLQQTLRDLLKSDEPPSPSTAAANERWLQMPHPEQFFKETDGFVVEGNGHLHPSSPVAAMVTRAGSDARDTKSQARDKMCSKAPAVLVLSEKENRECKVPVKGVSEKKQAATAATRGGMDGGRDSKRRRAPGSVSTIASKSLASRANTTGIARRTGQQAAKDKLKDPMKKKLEEYKRNIKPALSARRTTGKVSGDACSEPKKTSVGGSRGLRSVNARNPSTLPTASRVGTRTVAAGKRPAVERGVRGESSQDASKKESSEMTVPPAMEVVTRSVKMVKRRTGGGVLGRGCGRDQANGGSSGTGAGVGGGVVKKTRRGPIGGDSRRAGPTRGGGKGKAAVGLNEPALVLDAQLEARLAEHNKGVARGKHTYEPKRNVRDTRMWEANTGKVYRSLTVDERADANKEIDAMRAAMRRATLGGH